MCCPLNTGRGVSEGGGTSTERRTSFIISVFATLLLCSSICSNRARQQRISQPCVESDLG